MSHAIIFDTEFLTNEDSYRRFWMGPHDPDPVVAQIGAVRLGLTGDFGIGPGFSQLVQPVDRFGRPIALHPAFTQLTGITQQAIDTDGLPLGPALAAFDAFTDGVTIWSWGKDELHLMAISPWIAGIPAPIAPQRFGNACSLLLRAGVPLETITTLRSHNLCAHFGLPQPAGRAHDALCDAQSVATVLQHLLATRRLTPDDFRNTAS
jgi:hypothetical protein